MTVTKTRIALAGAAVLALAMVMLATRPDPEVIDIAVVGVHDLEATVQADGLTRVRERYVVTAPIGGRVERTTHLEGSVVRAGEVVARIAPMPLDAEAVMMAQARLDAAEALALAAAGQVRAARAALDQRQRELSRANRLADVGGIAPRVVEECRLGVVEAEESLRGAEHRASAAEAGRREARAALAARDGDALATIAVRAPASGVVLRIAERSERVVSPGAPLMEVGDPRSLEVVIDVLSSEAEAMHAGDRIRIITRIDGSPGSGQPLGARIRRVEPAGFSRVSALGVEEQRVNVIADLDSIPRSLGDGFRVDGTVILWTQPRVLAVPRSAVLQLEDTPSGWGVFVVKRGRAEQRAIHIGRIGDTDVEVREGLRAGDTVVVFPPEGFMAGIRVKVRSAS